jgi:excisionase family DNA binding protein
MQDKKETTESQYLTPQDIATTLRVNASTVRRWAQKGRISCVILPSAGAKASHKMYRIPRDAVEKLLQTNVAN